MFLKLLYRWVMVNPAAGYGDARWIVANGPRTFRGSPRVTQSACVGTVPRMARRMLAGVAIAASLGVVGTAAAGQTPLVRSVKVVHRHVVLELTVGTARPVEFTAAKRRAVDAEGALLPKNVRLHETIRLPASASGVVRWQSPKTLGPGTYFVQVKAVDTGGGGVTDCPPKQVKCNVRWSGLHRVFIRR